MSSLEELCTEIESCIGEDGNCGHPNDQTWQRWIIRLLKCIAEGTSPTEPAVPAPTCSVTSFCNEDTDTHICKKVCVVDGIEQPPVEVDTGIACDIEICPEINYVCNQTTGFYDEILTVLDCETGDELSEVITPTTYVCPPLEQDCELTCASTDKRPLLIKITKNTDGTVTSELTEVDGSAIADGAVAANCDVEYKYIENCWQDAADPSIRYTQLVCLNADDLTAAPVIVWIAADGSILPGQPAGSEACVDAEKYDYELGEFCFTHTVAGETVCESRPMLTAVPCDVAPADVVPGMVSEIRFEAGFAALFDEANYVDFSDSSCKRDDCQKQLIECKKKEFYFGLENTGLRYNFFYDVELVLKNGETRVVTLPSASNWGPQMAAWATALESAFPEACEVANHWWEWRPAFLPNTGAGAVPAADMNFPASFGQFIQFTFCPTDCGFMPVSATVVDTDHPNRLGYELIVATDESDVEYLTYCVTCDEDCVSDEIPKCCIPVADTFPELPQPACSYNTLEVCEFAYPADPESGDAPTLVTPDVILQYEICGGSVELQGAYTLDVDGNLEEHVLAPGNYYGDCDTAAEIEPPVPPCPEGAVFSAVEVKGSYFILDNSNWIGAPTAHITNGFNFEFTFTCEDGSQVVAQQTADPLYANMLSEFASALGCKVVPVCANHTSPNGCHASHVANLASYPAYDAPTFPGDVQNNLSNPEQSELWASGWLLDCGECDCKVVKVEITNSNDPAYIGAYKEPIVYDKEPEIVYQAVTCDGVFYKDCEGNDIAAPSCCPTAPTQKICLPEELIQECNSSDLIPEANYDGAIQWVNGRPNTTATWELIDNRDPLNQVVVATGTNFNEFIANMEALGYQEWSFGEAHFFCPCPPGLVNAGDYFVTANGNTVSKPACRPLGEVPIPPAKPNTEGEVEKSLRVALDSCTLKELIDNLKDCEGCEPIVETDAVCNDTEQTVDDVTIGAGQPIIRKAITFFVKEGCECVETGTAVRFFDFNAPEVEFTSPVAFTSVCDFEADTITRCDRNGNEIKVTTIVVNTPDGGVTTTNYADANGDPIPEPLLPLSLCNPQIQDIKGCVENADGSIEYGVLHLQYDNVGKPGYDVSFFTSNSGGTSSLGTRKFICKPGPTENCPLVQDEYCYDVSSFTFACPTSTIEINSQVVDLCGGETSIIPSSGDLCTVGGVRSNTTGDRCRTAYPEPTTDPAGLATELQNFGSFGDELVNPNVGTGGFTTSNFYMAVRGTFPSLEGTTAPTIDLTTTWEVGSGISIHAYDCATGNDLPLVSGTPTTYAPDAACSDGTRGPIDSWGNANNGMTQTTVFDTSGVTDLGNVIFWSIVLNPPGDAIKDVMVNGLTPGGTCDVTDIVTLTQILEETTGTPWTINGNVICTKTTDELGALTCGTVAALPTVTDCTVDREVQLVKVCQDEPCPDLVKVEYCVQSKGSIKTVKSVKAVKSIRTLAKTSEAATRVKESESKPGKILPMCEIRRYVCGEYDYSTFFYQGKEVDQATFDKFGLSIVDCSTPDASYTAGAVTCATEERFVEGVLTQVVLNCAVFTNDSDPTDVFTQYTLADSYAGIGDIGDLYQEVGTPVACPPGSITEQCDCFEAVAAIKGVANAGDTVEQCAVSNAIAGTTFYTITHTGSQAVIYTGTDPVADAGIDFGNAAQWTGPVACQPAVVAVGDEIPVGYECVDGLPHLMIAIRDADGLIIGDRSIESTVVGLCDCCAEKCAADHCIRANLFDSTNSIPVVGQTDTFQLLIDGVVQTTVVHDYTTTTDGVNKSSWYTPIVAAVNALPGWSMALISDAPVGGSSRPTYEITYSGSTPQTLRITKAGSNDWTEYVADGAGNMVGNWSWSPDSTPFVACP